MLRDRVREWCLFMFVYILPILAMCFMHVRACAPLHVRACAPMHVRACAPMHVLCMYVCVRLRLHILAKTLAYFRVLCNFVRGACSCSCACLCACSFAYYC